MFTELRESSSVADFICEKILGVLGIEKDAKFSVQLSKNRQHGDYAWNAAMIIAKQAKRKPQDIALEHSEVISKLDFVDRAEVAGSGFVNIFVKNQFLHEAVNLVSESYGVRNVGKGEKVNIEFVSANPTGPLHIGHTRSAVYGDVLARLLEKSGFDVTREYYVNDAGAQMNVLTKSIFIRYKQLLGEDIEIPEGCYGGEYLIESAKRLRDEFGDELSDEDLDKVREFATGDMMTYIKNDLESLNIKHDVFLSEKSLIESGKVDRAVKILDEKGVLYYGKLPPPKMVAKEEWELEEQLIFRSTDYGDDVDRSVRRSDGSNTYFSSDIACQNDKLERGFERLILILGADHSGYVKRISAATYVLSGEKAVKMDVQVCQLVNFLRNGVAMKMSKRKGVFATAQEVIEEVGADIVRFMMLVKKNDLTMNFDLETVKLETKDSLFFYIQYAYSRMESLIGGYRELLRELKKDDDKFDDVDLKFLDSDSERDIIKKILDFPRVMEIAVKKHEPNLVSSFVCELSSLFHCYWTAGKENYEMKIVVKDNLEITRSRIFLVRKMLNIFLICFSVLGVEPLGKM